MMRQRDLEHYLLDQTMRKQVEDAIDRFDWVMQVASSCITRDQLEASRNLLKLCESVNHDVMHIGIIQDKQKRVVDLIDKKINDQLNTY